MARYPLGGMLSCALQWLAGFRKLGHDVYVVEKAQWENSCYDPVRNVTSNECTYGVNVLRELLARFGLEDRWCFVDVKGNYYGIQRQETEELFRTADVFIDYGTHAAWLDEASTSRCRVYVDGEPGLRQMSMQKTLEGGGATWEYDYYVTTGLNIGTPQSSAPAAGKTWIPLFHPVMVDLFTVAPVVAGSPFTTVMNWQSHAPFLFRGVCYGQKDVEFNRIMDLPQRTAIPLEVAVSGKTTPFDRLQQCGWRLRDAHEVTISYDSFVDYISSSRGELSICKHGYVATNSGWFSDRSGVYLSSGRPVILQDTGFSDHIPCGEGLLAFRTVEEAAGAVESVSADWERHSHAARNIAREYLDAPKVLKGMLDAIGIQ